VIVDPVVIVQLGVDDVVSPVGQVAEPPANVVPVGTGSLRTTAPLSVPPELATANWYVIGATWPGSTVTPSPGVGSLLVTATDGALTTGFVTVFVEQVAVAHDGVLTLVKVAWLEMVAPFASAASTFTWNVRLLVLNAPTDVNVHVMLVASVVTPHAGVDGGHAAELAT